MWKLLTGKKTTDTVRFNVAKDILDRAGFKPVEKHEVSEVWDGDLSKLTDEALERISEHFWNFIDPARRDELRRQVIERDGPVIDVQFVNALPAPDTRSAAEDQPVISASEDDEDGW